MQQHPAIAKTKAWLEEIVIGLNFCPFAKKEFVNNTIRYHDSKAGLLPVALEEFADECQYLLANPDVETTLIIYTTGFRQFDKYLDLVDYANDLLIDMGLEGEIQVASFHPEYVFDGERDDEPSNYTNRSPLPMLHLIREASMEKVLALYPHPEQIPDNNIALAQDKGTAFFKQFLARLNKM
ncbi:DUF1415 domain-containing protein [Colwellia sp. MEBiC06753]